MKKTLLAASLLALMACTASAAGINMSWTDCGAFGAVNDNALCNSNNGVHTLVGSYIPPAGLLEVNGNEFVIDLQTDQAALSEWWNMGSVSATPCPGRNLQPSFDFNFLANVNCTDFWQNAALGGGGYLYQFGGALNRARIVGVVAIAEASAAPQDPATEYYSFKILIGNARTVGTPNCPGCTDAACLVLNSIKITQNTTQTENPTVTTPIVSQSVTWRGGLSPDCQATPARQTTWGSVKALYR